MAQTTARFLDYFTSHIRNKNTRRAYGRTVGTFMTWAQARGLRDLREIQPIHIGDGVSFKSISFEFVGNDEPLTQVLVERLPLLKGQKSSVGFPRDPDGKHRPYRTLPFPHKMSTTFFFGLGEY